MGSPIVFNSGYAKLLAKLGLKLNDGTTILSGADDPAITNPSAANGSVYLSSVYGIYSRKGGVWYKIADTSMLPPANDSILNSETADLSILSNFTQTGLEILDTPIVLHGTKSFRLQHATSIKSFKKVIAVDKKFRGKNNTVTLDVLSTATSGNLNVLFYDETNTTNLAVSQVIATNSAAITATTANLSDQLTGMDNSTLNSLKVGMVITGSAIPVGTTITAISATAATMSAQATGVSTGIRISDLPAKKTFSFDVPNNCLSMSWTISTVVEASVESYIDDIVIQLTAQALSSTSITIPRKVLTKSYTPTLTGFGTPTNVEFEYDEDGEYYNIRGKFTSGTSTAVEARISLPNSATSASGILLPSIAKVGDFSTTNNGAFDYSILAEPSVQYLTMGYGAAGTNGLTKATGSNIAASTNIVSFFARVPIANASATESKTIPLTTAQLVQEPDSYIKLTGGTMASGAVMVYTTIAKNIGNAFSVNISTGVITVLKSGIFDISCNNTQSSGTTGVYLMAGGAAVAYDGSASAGEAFSASASVQLSAGDTIYCVNPSSGTAISGFLSVTHKDSLKQLNPSSDSKITIPTHQLRFEGASSRGSTDTSIVKFDTQAITQGDAWDVVNTAANGTVITMKKAGKLSVGTSVQTAANQDLLITKNQVTLNAWSLTTAEIVAHAEAESVSITFLNISNQIDVVIGDKIRVASTANPNSNTQNLLTLSLTETSIPANFSNVLPQWSQSDSSIKLQVGNGFGSTNTLVRRFSNLVHNLGTDVSYTDSATLGGSFEILKDGTYDISYTDEVTTASSLIITKNQINGTNGVNILAVQTMANGYLGNASISIPLVKGDVVRFIGGSPANFVSASSTATVTISKVGKPNLTSVDVTPFVNMKTTDTQSSFLTQSVLFGGNTTITGALSSNTNTGIYIYNATTGVYTALKSCNVNLSGSYTANANASVQPLIYVRGLVKAISSTPAVAGERATVSGSYDLVTGDTFSFYNNGAGATSSQWITVLATADNNATASPTQQVSSDTIPFVFKATAIDPAVDPIGTYNTFTFAANSSSPAIAAANQTTQTSESMNINGIQLFGRPYSAASISGQPCRFSVFIGKGLSSEKVRAYSSAGKVGGFAFDFSVVNSNTEYGTLAFYDQTSGILILDAGMPAVASTTRLVGAIGNSSGYFAFNASKAPSLVTIPNVQPKVAYLSDVKASGTSGGSSISGSQTRTLNTIVDNTGIVTSLTANQFTLPAGTYMIEASAPTYASNNHKIRIRNITDSSTSLIGTSSYTTSAYGVENKSTLSGEITITSPKVFELQHHVATATAGNGLGTATSSGENEVYAQVKITKIK